MTPDETRVRVKLYIDSHVYACMLYLCGKVDKSSAKLGARRRHDAEGAFEQETACLGRTLEVSIVGWTGCRRLANRSVGAERFRSM